LSPKATINNPTESEPVQEATPHAGTSASFSELLGRVAIVALYLWLVVRVLDEWRRTGHITGLFLITTAALLVYFTVRRRPAHDVERSWLARIVALAGTLGSLAFRPTVHSSIPDLVTAWLSLAGTAITISGIIALGRSFGLVAANRGVIRHGIYRWIRHPLYTGYFLSHLGFILSFPTPWNLAFWVLSDGSQLVRILLEERLLSRDPAYVGYMSQVRWRMLPGIF
jgi:protein-S-isoprenylcysteine O-methyltransferase Ste14